jgi:hypothetical protein
MYGSQQYEAWGGLLESVRDGAPAFDHVFGTSYFTYLAAHPDAGSIFNDAMTGWTAQLSDAVVAAYDFSGPGLVVDVGGGTGLLLATILKAAPALRGVDGTFIWTPSRDQRLRSLSAAFCRSRLRSLSARSRCPGGAPAAK